MQTVVFFDLFDFPATPIEIWQNTGSYCGLGDAAETLDDLAAEGRIGTKHGFYFLSGRSGLLDERRRRQLATERKFKRVKRVTRIFALIPWVRLVAVGNLIGGDNLKEESDIDLFIVTSSKRVWLTRFFCAGFLRLFDLRPRAGKKRDQICLSFYVSEDALDLKPLMLGEEVLRCGGGLPIASTPDIYFFHWFSGLTPVYDAGGCFRKLGAANSRLSVCLPNWQPVVTVKRRQAGRGLSAFYRDVADLFIGGLESTVKIWQLRIMPEELKSIMNTDTRVVANDSVIKLHANDRREEYRAKYLEEIAKNSELRS